MNALNNPAVEISDVVLNDTTTLGFDASKPLLILESKRINWEKGAYRTSNQDLYAILAECLGYASTSLEVKQAKARSNALAEFFQARNYKYDREAPLITRVVKAVFGNIDRRRVSTYSLVLRQAIKENVSALDLPNWIENKGGVQEIKLGHSISYISPKSKADIGKNILNGKIVLGYAKSELLSHIADAEFMGTTCVLLADQLPNGSFEIKAVVRSTGAINAAYMALYSQQSDSNAAAKKEVGAANDADGAIAKQA